MIRSAYALSLAGAGVVVVSAWLGCAGSETPEGGSGGSGAGGGSTSTSTGGSTSTSTTSTSTGAGGYDPAKEEALCAALEAAGCITDGCTGQCCIDRWIDEHTKAQTCEAELYALEDCMLGASDCNFGTPCAAQTTALQACVSTLSCAYDCTESATQCTCDGTCAGHFATQSCTISAAKQLACECLADNVLVGTCSEVDGAVCGEMEKSCCNQFW